MMDGECFVQVFQGHLSDRKFYFPGGKVNWTEKLETSHPWWWTSVTRTENP